MAAVEDEAVPTGTHIKIKTRHLILHGYCVQWKRGQPVFELIQVQPFRDNVAIGDLIPRMTVRLEQVLGMWDISSGSEIPQKSLYPLDPVKDLVTWMNRLQASHPTAQRQDPSLMIPRDSEEEIGPDWEKVQARKSYPNPPWASPKKQAPNWKEYMGPPSDAQSKLTSLLTVSSYPVEFLPFLSGENPSGDCQSGVNNINQFLKGVLEGGLTAQNYTNFLHLLLHAEEYASEVALNKCTQFDVPIELRYHASSSTRLSMVKLPGVEDRKPDVKCKDRVDIIIGENVDHVFVKRDVLDVIDDRVFFKPPRLPEVKCTVRFVFNRITFKHGHAALNAVDPLTIKRVFPEAIKTDFPPLAPVSQDRLFNVNVGANPQQFQAVQHIVSGSSYPHPYILFGPPGTGKTMTVVEAISQVFKSKDGSRILVCAPSNSAAVVLAKGLMKNIPLNQIIRGCSSRREGMTIDSEVRSITTYGVFEWLTEMIDKRIVVLTLGSAGNIKKKGSFSHVFIDEAGQANEVESIIPVAGALGPNGQWVLAGDPYQLGPYTNSTLGKNCGLNVSLLERLMEQSPYSPDDEKNRFRPQFITKLVNNFRSHAHLLKVPSELFYDNELVPRSPNHLIPSQSWMPNPKFPLIFHGVQHHHHRAAQSTSLGNNQERQIVWNYVKRLLPIVQESDIGILTPYRCQARLIGKGLHRSGFANILVGSTEEFQGQERRVMILSTVRSSLGCSYSTNFTGGTLGFLAEPKRFNVSITRAKQLLIVVGDACLLSQDPPDLQTKNHWRALVEHAKSNGITNFTGGTLGFLAEPKRFNVSITRAKQLLIVVGDACLLSQDPRWSALVEHAKSNGAFLEPH
eukprot:snap_masked-scaffold821_size92673-processed-gene-0.12 protein:Tk12554 transcript:snap_masked-scaffold821_size92673-processed-gene-0.12-mRNA-1 annotation:"helicase mov-10- -like"